MRSKTFQQIFKYRNTELLLLFSIITRSSKRETPDLCFSSISFDDVKTIMRDLNNMLTAGDFPVKILNGNEFCYKTLTDCINNSGHSGIFSNSFKYININPVYENKDPCSKASCRPATILSTLYQKSMQNRLINYPIVLISSIVIYCVAFEKPVIPRHASYRLLQSWQNILDLLTQYKQTS